MRIIDAFLTESFFSGKINAPTFAYKCLNNKFPNPPISGREASHDQINYKGIMVDKHIPSKALDLLNKLDIDIRATCEGDSERHLTFLIFRLRSQNVSETTKLVTNLNRNKTIKSCWDIGQANLPRIVVTADLWYGKTASNYFNKWWEQLSHLIKKAMKG